MIEKMIVSGFADEIDPQLDVQLKVVKDVETEGEFPSQHLLLNYPTRNMQYILNHRCQIKRFSWCVTTFKIVTG